MEMKDMSRTKAEIKAEKKMYDEPALVGDENKYPYGLTIRLDESSLKKLGIENKGDLPQAGDKMQVCALCKVEEVESREKAKGKNKQEICLQICEMSLEPDKSSSDAKAMAAFEEAEEDGSY